MINHLSCVCMCLWVWLNWQTLLYCIFTILACCKGPKGLEVHWLVGSMQLPHANLTKYHPSWHSAGRQEYLVSTFSRCRKKGERTYAIVLIPSIINNTIQIKLRWALFVTYTITQSIMRSEMCSLHLTHPSALGAVGSRLCSARGAVVDFQPEPGFKPTTLGYLGFQAQRSIH